MNCFRITFINAEASRFFIKLFQDMIKNRQLTREKRNDFMNLMIELIEKRQEIEEDNDNLSTLDNDTKGN